MENKVSHCCHIVAKVGFMTKEKFLNRCYTAFRRLFFVVPPGNIFKTVMHCVSI